ncbi:MAG: type II toxin-antitoxin system PemK/MazF family toxin [Gammaproteobacteria bacterium]
MPITFHPDPGTLLVCDFSTGFQPPEMVKKRPIVVISPRRRVGSGICTVVPISTTSPHNPQPYHHQLNPASVPQQWRGVAQWAKCDMVTTVGHNRLELIRIKNFGQNRQYVSYRITDDDLKAILAAVGVALGI